MAQENAESGDDMNNVRSNCAIGGKDVEFKLVGEPALRKTVGDPDVVLDCVLGMCDNEDRCDDEPGNERCNSLFWPRGRGFRLNVSVE